MLDLSIHQGASPCDPMFLIKEKGDILMKKDNEDVFIIRKENE